MILNYGFGTMTATTLKKESQIDSDHKGPENTNCIIGE